MGVVTQTAAASPHVYLTDGERVLVPIEEIHSILVQKTSATLWFRSGRPAITLPFDFESDASSFMKRLHVYVFTRTIVKGRSRRKA